MIDSKMHTGFRFEVYDLFQDKRIVFATPGELYDLLMFIGAPARFDGPPRVVALGFQIKDGRLIGPRDMFADPSFDRARATANEAMDYLRRHGPFEPHRLALQDLEYTTMRQLEQRLADRWEPLPKPAKETSAIGAR